MTRLSATHIAVAANYLRPMTTPTNIAITAEDTNEAGDALEAAFAENSISVVRLAIGGENPALAQMEIADLVGGEAKVLLVEAESDCAAYREVLEASAYGSIQGCRLASVGCARSAATAVVLVLAPGVELGHSGRTFVQFEIKMPEMA